jgi:hypothetical protein
MAQQEIEIESMLMAAFTIKPRKRDNLYVRRTFQNNPQLRLQPVCGRVNSVVVAA